MLKCLHPSNSSVVPIHSKLFVANILACTNTVVIHHSDKNAEGGMDISIGLNKDYDKPEQQNIM